MPTWNPWHGCHKFSEGCQHCYVYRQDERYGRDPAVVARTGLFDLPVRRNRQGNYKIPAGETLYTCFTSDFFVEDADNWRPEVWTMIRQRIDLRFLIITKRIHRFPVGLPDDWNDGYDHVSIYATVENQQRADERLPILLAAPIRHIGIICEPILGPIDLSAWLTPAIREVVVGGESGPDARICRFDWVLAIRAQCERAGVPFHFKQTGARFEKDGKNYRIARKDQHAQARKAGIDLSAHPYP